MEERIFVLSALLEDPNALPVAYTDVFDSEEAAKEAMKNWRERLVEEYEDTTIKEAEESFDKDDYKEVEEYVHEWTMSWYSPTYELHFSQEIKEFVKVDGKFKRVSHVQK